MPKIDVAPMLGELWHIAVAFWPMWTLFVLAGCVKFGWELRIARRLARSGISEIDLMNGAQFERRLAVLFHDLGYVVKLTQQGADHGADLVIEKDGRKTAVQAKRWSRRVGNSAVQEIVAAKPMYGCAGALVVTNSHFTNAAQRLARANNVTLWDRETLVKFLLENEQEPRTASSLEPA